MSGTVKPSMEPRSLTTWEQKERDGLLALETDEWRQKRHIAEDPNTTADILAELSDSVHKAYHTVDSEGYAVRGVSHSACLLAEAIAAHPNVPPQRLLSLLLLPAPFALFCPRGLCRNPIAPVLQLETPDFWGRLTHIERSCSEAVLREATVPLSANIAMSQSGVQSVVQSALLHVNSAGELTTPAEGTVALTQFWQAFCVEESRVPRLDTKRFEGWEWYTEIVEYSLAPRWALGEGVPMPRNWPKTPLSWDRSRFPPHKQARAERIERAWSPETQPDVLIQLAREPESKGSAFVRRLVCRHPNAPPEIQAHARYGFLASVEHGVFFDHFDYPRSAAYPNGLPYNRTAFVALVANLHGAFRLSTLCEKGQSSEWMERLNTALALTLSDAPFAGEDERGLPIELWNRSPLDLLQHLACDGNRFVRWAAQTRLADPDFVFTWYEGE